MQAANGSVQGKTGALAQLSDARFLTATVFMLRFFVEQDLKPSVYCCSAVRSQTCRTMCCSFFKDKEIDFMEVDVILILPDQSPKNVKANLAASLDKMKSDIVTARPELGKAEDYDLLVLPRDNSLPLQNYRPGAGDTLIMVKKLSLQGPSITGL